MNATEILFINTTHTDIEVNKPVVWKKQILLVHAQKLKINLPESASNISLDSIKQKSKKKIAHTTRQKDSLTKQISSDEINEEYSITYETPGPEQHEENITRQKKRVSIRAADNLNYTEINTTALLPYALPREKKDRVKLYWLKNNSRQEHPFTLLDIDNDTLLDTMVWTTPDSSNQTFEIILITNAEHLDSNREFINNIYEQVRELDGNWSETIPAQHYIRATFEKNLTANNDITIYPRIVSGNPKITVYEKDSDQQIAEFTKINSNQYNRVVLTALQNTQDTFDLQVTSGAVEIDHIIDPTISACSTLSTANSIYTLTANAVPVGVVASCMNITAKNVTLDCQGFSISNKTQQIPGVYSNQEYTTIKNCKINMSASAGGKGYGITLFNSNYSNIINNTFIGDVYGIYLENSAHNNISSNIIYNISVVGIVLNKSLNNTLFNNTINHTSRNGIQLIASSNNSIISNTIKFNRWSGISLDFGSNYTLINNNTISNSTNSGINITSHSLSTNITNNIINNNTRNGIYVSVRSHIVNITNNTISLNRPHGILLSGVENATIQYNRVDFNIMSGIWIHGGSNLSFVDRNVVVNNSLHGINISEGSLRNNITRNIASNNTQAGIIIGANSHLNNLTNNSIVFNKGMSGVRADATLNTTIVSNIIIFNIGSGLTLLNGNNYTQVHFNVLNNNTVNGLNLTVRNFHNNFTYNTAHNNSQGGFVIFNSSNNTFIGSALYNNSGNAINLTSSQNNTFHNTTINNNFYGIGFNFKSLNNQFFGLTINNSGRDALFFNDSFSSGNNFTNLTFILTNPAFHDIRVADRSLNNTQFTNANFTGNYSFNGSGGIVWFKHEQFGEIRFLRPINGTANNLSDKIRFGNNSVFVNETIGAFGLNRSANVTLYGVPNYTNPSLLKNGENCPTSICSNFTSLSAGTVSFNVTYWSNYSINGTEGAADNTVPITTLIAPSNNTATATATYSFNSTFSDETALANATLYIWNSSSDIVNNTETRTLSGTVGSSNITLTLPYDDNFTWNYLVKDSSNNMAWNNTNFTFILDRIQPFINFSIETEANNSVLTRTNIVINVTATDLALVNITINLYNASGFLNQTNTSTTSSFFINYTALANGTYFFNATAADTVNNINRTETRNITINTTPTNSAPLIILVTNIPDQSITEDTTTKVWLNFTAYDADGFGNLNDASALANFTRAGEAVRQNLTCVKLTTYSSFYANYTCAIDVWYFDGSGIWNISVAINDTSNEVAVNSSATTNQSLNFTLLSTTAFTSYPTSLTFASINPGGSNQSSNNDPLTLNNTGNKNITVGNVEMNATNLLGETDSTKGIYAGNFSIGVGTGSNAECDISSGENNASSLVKGLFQAVNRSSLSQGNHSANNGIAGQEQLYICIRFAGNELSAQSYSTSNQGSWTIRILAIALSFNSLRKRKKKEIPLSIFIKELGALETLCKYLNENLGLRYCEIAQILQRDERTVWTAHHQAIKKHPQPFAHLSKTPSMPLEQFTNKKYTSLETSIIYLKEEKGMKYSEIAIHLQRDQRNIRTIYTNALQRTNRQEKISRLPKEIPLSIFTKELGALEALTQYLKEEESIKYSEIARFLGKDPRTVWTAHHQAIKKHPQPFASVEKSEKVPANIFKKAKDTVLASLVHYLKKQKHTYKEIGELINRNQRNVRRTGIIKKDGKV